jgi:uncharacterized Zn-finger protein
LHSQPAEGEKLGQRDKPEQEDHSRSKCEYCGALRSEFQSSADFMAHTHQHKGMYPCARPGCKTQMKSKNGIANHMKTHRDDLAHECTHPGCGKQFERQQGLAAHMASHSDDRPFVCTHPGCNTRFKRKSTLSNHMQTHRDDVFVCTHPGCGRRFARKQALVAHAVAHSDDRPYACAHPGCDRRFKTSILRSKHKRVHADARYQCTICKRKFKRKDCLTRHLQTTHKTDVGEDGSAEQVDTEEEEEDFEVE